MNGYLGGTDAETFDLDAYLSTVDVRLTTTPEGRRELTRMDPLAFALVYFGHHLQGDATGGRVSFADLHLDLIRHALEWVLPLDKIAAYRDAYVAPRDCGKSTWLHLILPMWAAAHGHIKFIATFSGSSDQAKKHLATFRHELDTNVYLRSDFPTLVAEARRPADNVRVATTQDQLNQANGFTLIAKGMESSVHGLKVNERRPELIILDDIEPGEATYSMYKVGQRLITLLDDVLPLNAHGRVILVGTVTRAGSIIHQLVKSVRTTEDPEEWVFTSGFKVHYYPPIVAKDDGTERSCWPAKWTLGFLLSIRATREFRKNFANEPINENGDFWTPDSFVYGRLPVTKAIISIDPAITDKKKSDFTGLSVVGLDPKARKVCVLYAKGKRIPPGPALREEVLKLIEMFPEVVGVLIETNQGGDVWKSVLHDLPVKLATVHQSESKEIRAGRVYNHYERGRVTHAEKLPECEEQMTGFPDALHDDIVDSVGSAITHLLDTPVRTGGIVVKSQSYV